MPRNGASLNVAILAGGRSSEREVSLSWSAVVAEGVAAAGHGPPFITGERSGGWRCDGEPVCLDPGEGLLDGDVVFPAPHGPIGQDGAVQGQLELLDIPYLAAGVFASSLAWTEPHSRTCLRRTTSHKSATKS